MLLTNNCITGLAIVGGRMKSGHGTTEILESPREEEDGAISQRSQEPA